MDVEGSDRDVFRGTVPSNVTEGAEKTPKTSVKVVSVPAEIRIFHLPQVPPERTLSVDIYQRLQQQDHRIAPAVALTVTRK